MTHPDPTFAETLPVLLAEFVVIFAIGLLVGIQWGWAFACGVGTGLATLPVVRWLERL